MLIALAARTAVVAAYLIALVLHGRAGAASGTLALAVVLVWGAPLLRDRLRRSAARPGTPGPVTSPGDRRAAPPTALS
jgi:hypothetical protein